MNKLTDMLNEILTEKKLCPKGRAYRQRRLAAGEKHSAYLSGRAVQVCNGRLKEEDDLDESLRDWFKKEDLVIFRFYNGSYGCRRYAFVGLLQQG